MQIKALEIRDDGTMISVLAFRLTPENPQQAAILRHAGYGNHPSDYVAMIDAHTCTGSTDPFKQPCNGRTRTEAHLWIREHFDELRDGDVVDVEFIRGERATPKTSEIQRYYGAATLVPQEG